MMFVVTPYALAQAASALISILASVIAWRRRKAPGGMAFALMMTAVSFWTAAVALDESVVGVGAKIILSKVSYLGVVNVAPLFLIFALTFGDTPRRVSPLVA